MKKKVLVIVNPVSGAGRSKALLQGFSPKNPSIKVLCAQAQVVEPEHWMVVETTQDGRWKKEALSYLQTKAFGLVVGVGGDGTLMQIAEFLFEALKNHGVVLPQTVFIPGGRGNDFIRGSMGYSVADGDFWHWAAKQKRWSLQGLDLGSANGRVFINMASIGYGAEVVQNVHSRKAFWSKSAMVYQLEGALTFFEKRKVECEIVVDDKRVYQGPFFGAFVGNGKANGAGLFWTPEAKFNDGMIDLIAFDRPGFFEMLNSLGLIKKKQNPSFKFTRAVGSQIDFHFDLPTAFELDGDFSGNSLSCGIKCLPNVLQNWVLSA